LIRHGDNAGGWVWARGASRSVHDPLRIPLGLGVVWDVGREVFHVEHFVVPVGCSRNVPRGTLRHGPFVHIP
jgi:hypothetical protein